VPGGAWRSWTRGSAPGGAHSGRPVLRWCLPNRVADAAATPRRTHPTRAAYEVSNSIRNFPAPDGSNHDSSQAT